MGCGLTKNPLNEQATTQPAAATTQEAPQPAPENASSELKLEITQMSLRRTNKDLYQISTNNPSKMSFPLGTLQLTIDEKKYFASVVSYNEENIKLLLLKSVGKLRPGYTLSASPITHQKPISFPTENNLIILSGLSLPIALQMNLIYNFDVNKNQYLLLSDDKENTVYQTAFKEAVPKFTELKFNISTEDLVLQTRQNIEKLTEKMLEPFENIIVVGPVWLFKLIKRVSNGKKFVYGFQTLFGVDAEKKVCTDKMIRLWMENIDIEDFDAYDLEMGTWMDQNE
ncbi:Conserved_hypothetical protein [Hexamita inflata]|uniref:Uncharacterized protein n=1 Tax=Hexamita inflata TaxID=28002 RepID=A0AA86PER4_9EUKA|nr:Conserved hypothetical protein [Hexamita inflata]CAI9937935.1 Conserved hypothetical protein [Hexamita inflata]